MDIATLHELALEGIKLEVDLADGQDIEQRLGDWHDRLYDAEVPVDELSDDRDFEDLQAARAALKTAIDQARTTVVPDSPDDVVAPPDPDES